MSASRRRVFLAGAAGLVAASLGRLRGSRQRIPRRATPGTRARALDVGDTPILVREDLFESGIYSRLRFRGRRS